MKVLDPWIRDIVDESLNTDNPISAMRNIADAIDWDNWPYPCDMPKIANSQYAKENNATLMKVKGHDQYFLWSNTSGIGAISWWNFDVS